jgi:hypothetical protein
VIGMTTRAQLEAFLARPWHRARLSKDRWTGKLASDGTVDHLLHLSDALRAHASTLGLSEEPSSRRADLGDLVRLKERLDLASQRLSGTR